MAAKNSSVIIATRIVFYGAGIKSWLVACLEHLEPYLLNKEPTKELSVCYHKDFKCKTSPAMGPIHADHQHALLPMDECITRLEW